MMKDDALIYCVYLHYTNESKVPFYVGIGKPSRPYKKNRSTHWKNIVAKYGLRIEIIFENLSREEVYKIEKDLILKYGRLDLGTGCLINLTDGGDNGTRGYNHTDKTKNKISRSVQKISKEVRNKMIESLRGRTRSEETKNKISKGLIGRTLSQETKDKLAISCSKSQKGRLPYSTGMLGHTHSKEAKLKMSRARINYLLLKNKT